MAIIGNGDIASVLIDKPDWIYFASGVSDSSETRKSEFDREKDLLFQQEFTKHLVYFSSLCVFYSDTPYAGHKKRMENYVKMFPHYTIVRIGNITWGKNPHTLINHFRLQKALGKKLNIQDTYRYIIDNDEFLHWMGLIPEWNAEMNLTGRKLSIQQIVNEYVNNS